MDSLVVLSRSQEVSMARLMTERISAAEDTDQHRSSYAHFRAADRAVEEALRTTLRDDIPPPLTEIATNLGYRTVTSLERRYPDLCVEISTKRRSGLKASPPPQCAAPVPRERIENALIEELRKDGLTSLNAVAASVGLRNRRRLYKGFNDLRRAIVAKNKRIRKQRLDAIENALRAAFDERPIPTVTELAHRLELRDVTRITSRFPELSAELRYRRQAEVVITRPRGDDHVRKAIAVAHSMKPTQPDAGRFAAIASPECSRNRR